jgi:hypothetical protein
MRKLIGILIISTLLVGAIIPVNGLKIDIIKINKTIPTTNPDNQNRLPWPGEMETEEIPFIGGFSETIKSNPHELEPILVDDNIISLIQQLDENLYLGYLENLTAFGPRVTTTQECDDAGEYIYNEFLKMGIDARKHEWGDEDFYGTNIVGTIPGIDSSSDEIYIICAHYDTVSGCPGADDDGSGTVAVMAAAYLMRQYAFQHTVKFVAFSGEEQGLWGSRYYAFEASENNENIAGVLNLDMIGFAIYEDDDDIVKIYENDESVWITDYTIDVANNYEPYIELEILPSGYSYGSDHASFWQAGYNAIFYAEYNYNDYYHTSKDRIEFMNIPYALKISKLAIATLSELSELTIIENPNKPSTPQGPKNGKAEVEYTYSTYTIDPQGDQIFYWFDWGDENNSGWIGPFNSGATAETSHIWSERGTYSIMVKAKDTNGHESEWSDPLSISMPKNNNYFINIFQNFFERYPRIYDLILKIF